MLSKDKYFQTLTQEELWQRYCGFLDLSIDEFMDIQRRLLMDEIDRVAASTLGKKIMGEQKPKSVEEFRHMVPLTTYEDYEPYLSEQREDALAVRPVVWAHTAGRGGRFKWVPYVERALEKHADAALAGLILAAADRRGEVKIREGSRFLCILAPRPYISGISSWLLVERFGLKLIPPPALAEKLEFRQRMEMGFQMGLRSGVDIIGALGTVLVKMGERFAEPSQGMNLSLSLLHPVVLFRLVRALLRSKIERRAMLPLDLWPAQGLTCSGTDASIYRKRIEHYWGKSPHEIYGATETGVIAVQSWVKKGMTLYPFLAFFEFIPESEWLKSRKNEGYQPATVLLNELEVGKTYELVITSFYGMPFLRYRLGDLIKVISLEEQETGIKLPQFVFHTRADDLIDLYSIIRLDERTTWQALDDSNVSYEDWSARKEYEGGWPVLHLYVELKRDIKANTLKRLLHEHLRAISPLYDEAIREVETNPVRVTLLSRGSFQRYYEEQRKAGADLAHLKPPRMNASDAVIGDLLRYSAGLSNRGSE